MKKIFAIFILTLMPFAVYAEAVSAKAYSKRVELLGYLRELEPIVKNFRGNNKDGQEAAFDAEEGKEGVRVTRYNELKNLYQEGLLYYYEGNHVNSYRRFLEAQVGMEQMLEEISQNYIERAEEMLKAAVEKKNSNNPEDRNLIDISIEFSNKTRTFNNFKTDRESPMTRRMYNPREFHYVINKYAIEKNMEYGYKFLGLAKQARIDALRIENNLMKHQKLQPQHRAYRIRQYFGAISLCRDAKTNAVNIFKLKYPYDNYYLFRSDSKSETLVDDKGNKVEGKPVVIEGVQMDYTNNPYVEFNDQKLNPALDLRIPENFRVDAADNMNLVYQEEVNTRIKLKWDPDRKKELIRSEANAGAAGTKQ